LAQRLQNEIQEMPELAEKLAKALVDDPPFALKEGGIFRDGYDAGLDQLRQGSRDGKSWISHLQEREIAATGIKSLKVRYNSVFGYFIEVTKSNLASVPTHYTRKQTTVGGERFITPELKEMEAKILGADERARPTRVPTFPKTARRDVARARANPANCGRHCGPRRYLCTGRNGASLPLLPTQAEQHAAARD
jgi:DNA mismatch repair protein MutS